MLLWWIGNAILILVVIPVVVFLLHRLLQPALAINENVDDIAEHATPAVAALDNVRELVRTRDGVKQVGGGLTRYVNAVDRIL